MRNWLKRLGLSTFFILAGTCYAEEVTGFRGINWGDKILESKEFIIAPNNKDLEYDEKCFVKNNDDLTLGVAKLSEIEYCTYKDAFYKAFFISNDMMNWDEIRLSVFNKYGEMMRPNPYMDNYINSTGKNTVYLSKDDISDYIYFSLTDSKIMKQIEKDKKVRAKESAQKGF